MLLNNWAKLYQLSGVYTDCSQNDGERWQGHLAPELRHRGHVSHPIPTGESYLWQEAPPPQYWGGS